MREPDKWESRHRSPLQHSYQSPSSQSEYEKEFPVPGRPRRHNDGRCKTPELGKSTSQSTEQINPRKRRSICYMRSCGMQVAHICKHVVGKHLRKSFATWLEMPLVARMESFKALLKQIETITKCKDHEALLQTVIE